MATNTPKLNLVKPDMADYADIRVLNQNMDILDREVGGLDYVKNVVTSGTGLTFTKKDDTEIQVPLNYLPITGGNLTGDITVLTKPVVTIEETITSENGYCIKYSNGYMEQHYKFAPTTAQFCRLNFLAPFIDTNYVISACGEKEDVTESGSFVDYVGDTLGATETDKVLSTTAVSLSYHYAWAFGTVGKQKIMVTVWGRWK